jgi:hypothetical protein
MPSLGRTIFRNRKIKLELRCQMYMAITVNILLWGCDTWALMKLRSFHHKCVRQLCGYTMFQVKEHKIKNEVYLKKANLQPIDTLITVRQLRFLTRVAEMDESRLTRQVMSSQGTDSWVKRHTLLLVSSQLDESNLISQHAAHCLYSCFLHIQYILPQSHQTLIYFATQFDRLTPSTLST